VRAFAPWLGFLGFAAHLVAHAAGQELIVGVHPYEPTRALITYHEKMSSHLSRSLARPVRIVTAPSVEAFGRRLLAGGYDLALGPGHLIRLAQVDHGWHPVARYVPDTPVLLLARHDAADMTLASLRGKRLATMGRARLATRAAEVALAAEHLLPARDFTLLETGSPANTVHALFTGKADMAVLTLASMSQVRRDEIERLRIVHELGTVPLMFFAAHPRMSSALREGVQRALLDYETPKQARPVVAGENELVALDVHLHETRRLLKAYRDSAAIQRSTP
jgi:phosphonate transport system substrate-binding protein